MKQDNQEQELANGNFAYKPYCNRQKKADQKRPREIKARNVSSRVGR